MLRAPWLLLAGLWTGASAVLGAAAGCGVMASIGMGGAGAVLGAAAGCGAMASIGMGGAEGVSVNSSLVQ